MIGLTATSTFMKQREDKELDDDDNITFTEEDMRDENGKPFHIIIWKQETMPTPFKTNPETCQENISCKITFITEEYVNAHAIVFYEHLLNPVIFPSTR